MGENENEEEEEEDDDDDVPNFDEESMDNEHVYRKTNASCFNVKKATFLKVTVYPKNCCIQLKVLPNR